MKNSKGYSKDCFECEKSLNYFCVASTGAGMDTEMLSDFGKRKLAINCPSQEGMLILHLTENQIREMTKGKLERVSEEAANKGLINAKMIKNYLTMNRDKIDIEVMGPCNLLPPYP